VAAVAYSGFLVYLAFPADGYGPTAVVSDLEAEGAPHGALLRILDAASGALTLILVPYLWWALPRGLWRRVAVWSTLVFAVVGIPAGLVALPCDEDAPTCAQSTSDQIQGMAHDVASIVSTTALIAAAGATALAVRREGPRWLEWAGWGTVTIQVATGLIFGAGSLADWETLAGVAQRVEIVGISAWMVCLGVYAATHGTPATRRGRCAPRARAARPSAGRSRRRRSRTRRR
jgi:hypothetical protein